MKQPRVIISLLSLSLILSNAWWAYQALDVGISYTYLQKSFRGKSALLAQTLSMLPVAADPNASKAEVIAAAQMLDGQTPHEKEGFVWVGQLGLRFDNEGRLVEVIDSPK